MKETIKNVLNHPIATMIVVGAVFGGVADIISTVKGGGRKPYISVPNAEKDELND